MLKQELLSKPSRIRNRILLQPLENTLFMVPRVALRCSSRLCFSWARNMEQGHGKARPWLKAGCLGALLLQCTHQAILNGAIHQGAERAGLFQGEEKLGNEGDLNEAPHCLNRIRLVWQSQARWDRESMAASFQEAQSRKKAEYGFVTQL